MLRCVFFLVLLAVHTRAITIHAAGVDPARLDAAAAALTDQIIAWRRDIHQNPELGNREFRTAAMVAEHLTKLGLEVRTKLAHTGVAAVLQGGGRGPVIALRADMDALPVKEVTDVPFRSTVMAQYGERTVPVMHACGHDMHTAILMGAAEVLAGLRKELSGTILFIFQPAEEGAPPGERGGAQLMLDQGLFTIVRPEAIFGLHTAAGLNVGTLGYRSGPVSAASNTFELKIRGRQTHGARPWAGVDPITVAAQIIPALQMIVSRQVDLTQAPVVLSIGSIHGGVRHNIIPEEVEMLGTLRTFDPVVRDDVLQRMRRTIEGIAGASGATAELTVQDHAYPVLLNDPALTTRSVAVLERIFGPPHVREIPLVTAADDFAFYANEVPGFFFTVGVTPAGQDAAQAPPNHSPRFYIDEAALGVGLRALLHVAVDYLQGSEQQH